MLCIYSIAGSTTTELPSNDSSGKTFFNKVDTMFYGLYLQMKEPCFCSLTKTHKYTKSSSLMNVIVHGLLGIRFSVVSKKRLPRVELPY